MSPGGDCCLYYDILGAWCACPQVGTVAFIMIFWGLGVHVPRWGLSPLLWYSGGLVCMSPGGDCRLCYDILGAWCACPQVRTVAFVMSFCGLGVHVSRRGLILVSASFLHGLD